MFVLVELVVFVVVVFLFGSQTLVTWFQFGVLYGQAHFYVRGLKVVVGGHVKH